VLKVGQKLSGPIVTGKSETYWGREVKRLFEAAGLSFSSHSCRRGAAKWEYRCGCDIETIKNVGRWASLENLSIYISETMALRKRQTIMDEIQFWISGVSTRIHNSIPCQNSSRFL
jgi:integrase